MKKLMIAAALAACGAMNGFPLESANVVGYQNINFSRTGYNYMCNTFESVDATKKMTLGDIVPNDELSDNTSIQFLTNKGTGNKVMFKGKEVNEVYIYWREDDEPEQGPGWYLLSDGNGDINQNARVIEVGDSFCFDNKDGLEAGVTFNGQVAGETTKNFTVTGYNYLGNCVPRKISLGDIVPNDELSDNTSIQFLTNKGTGNKVMFKGKEVNEVYIYWREDDEPEQGPGWYLLSDGNGDINQNARVIEAGEGFCFDNKDGLEAGVTLPAGIEKK